MKRRTTVRAQGKVGIGEDLTDQSGFVTDKGKWGKESVIQPEARMNRRQKKLYERRQERGNQWGLFLDTR